MKLSTYGLLLRVILLSELTQIVDNLQFTDKYSRTSHCKKRFNNFLLSSNLFSDKTLIHIVRAYNSSADSELVDVEGFFESRFKIITESGIDEVRDILTWLPDFYVVFIGNYDNLDILKNAFHQVMLYTQSWNSMAKFLVFATTNISADHDSLVTDSFNFLWSKNAFRVAIALCVKTSGKATLFSSSPYSKRHRTCRNVTEPDQMQKINLSEAETPFGISGYSFRAPLNFLGCPLLAKTYPISPYSVAYEADGASLDVTYSTGLEVELVRLLAKVNNFSLSIKTPSFMLNPWFRVLPNGERVGMFPELLSYEIDIAFGGAIPSPEYFRLSQVFPPYFNSMSWYVPDPDMVPGWRLLVYAFSASAWLSLITAAVAYGVLYRMMWLARSPEAPPVEPILLSMVRMTLGTSALCRPKRMCLRIMLVAWSLFGLNVTIMYSTTLFSEFTERPLFHGITTLEELHASRLRTCMTSNFRMFFSRQTEGVIREMLEDAITCDNITGDIHRFLAERDFSLLTKDDHVSLVIDVRKGRVHNLAQKFITYPVSMQSTKGAVHLDALKRLILNVSESGIHRKWLFDVQRNAFFKFNANNSIVDDESDHNALKREDYLWLYKLLLLGDFVSFLVFIVELCFGKFYKHRPPASTWTCDGSN